MRLVYALIALLGMSLPASAQNSGEWVNAELLSRNLPQAQYIAIGRGDIAQCDADARSTVRNMPTIGSCERVDVGMYNQCLRAKAEAEEQQKQTFKDLYGGCMARRGWVWRTR